MKARSLAAAAGAALAFAVPAHAQPHGIFSQSRGAYVDRSVDNVVHSGGTSVEDQLLAEMVAKALMSDIGLAGATVTVAVNGGDVMLSGSAGNLQQAARAEKIASDIAGRARVSGTLDTQPS